MNISKIFLCIVLGAGLMCAKVVDNTCVIYKTLTDRERQDRESIHVCSVVDKKSKCQEKVTKENKYGMFYAGCPNCRSDSAACGPHSANRWPVNPGGNFGS